MTNIRTLKIYKKKIQKALIFFLFFLVSVIFLGSLAVSKVFYFREIKTTVYNPENNEVEIQNFVTEKISSDGNTFSQNNFFLFNKNKLERILVEKYPNIQKIETHRNFDLSLFVNVYFYKPIFVGCIDDEEVLIRCMDSDESGVFQREVEGKLPNLYYIEMDKKALHIYDPNNENSEIKDENIDSIVNTRLYSKKEMDLVFEFAKWLESENFKIDKIHTSGLGILDFYTDKYIITFSLEKGFANSIKEYNFAKENEPLKSLIKNNEIVKIDISYKDKIFYKIKGLPETEAVASTTSKTTENITSTTTIQ